MREIKFRGHNGSEWLYGDIVSYKSPVLEFTEYWMADCKSDKDNDNIQNWDSVGYVGQYTGLKDKNGVEIYEGDIIDIGNGEMFLVGWHEYMKEFTFVKNKNYFHKTYRGQSRDTWIVIGNIYENPNLL